MTTVNTEKESSANDEAKRLVQRFVIGDGDWHETTTRKGKHKICRDTFIAKSHDRYELGVVKNSILVIRHPLSCEEKDRIVENYKLEYAPSTIFRYSGSYRTPQSNSLIKWLRETYQ